jgi:hypothetical protein
MSNKSPRLTAVPASKSKLPILRIRLILVLSTFALSSLMGIFATVAWVTNNKQPITTQTETPYGKGLAELAVISWLDGKDINANKLDTFLINSSKSLQHGPVVWDTFVRKTLPAPSNMIYENHQFITTIPYTNADNIVEMTTIYVVVSIAFPENGSPYIASQPSFKRIKIQPSDASFDYTNISSTGLPGNSIKQVTAWANAFASDNRDQLKLLSGDTTDGYEYPGIGNFTANNVSVISAIYSGNTVYGNDTWLARVRFTLSSANLFNQDTEMDLTIVDGSTGLPKIIGYGPAGSGLRASSDTRVKI